MPRVELRLVDVQLVKNSGSDVSAISWRFATLRFMTCYWSYLSGDVQVARTHFVHAVSIGLIDRVV